MDSPLVSVVIPCYNAERWLDEAVESVFAQTWPRVEIVLVDDGSTDGTRAIIEAWGDRVRAVHGPNCGAAAARATGTQLASSDFLQYLDCDDVLAPDAIATRMEALLSTGADVAYGDWQHLVQEPVGSWRSERPVARMIEAIHPDPRIATFTSFWSPPAALLYRRAIVARAGGWKQEVAPIEDARLLQDAALAGATFVHVPGVRASYRWVSSESSHSRRSPLRFARAVLRNTFDIEEAWRAAGLAGKDARAALASAYDHCARELFRDDSKGFGEALAGLYRNEPGWRPSWPKLAGTLAASIGKDPALAVLRLLRRPAP